MYCFFSRVYCCVNFGCAHRWVGFGSRAFFVIARLHLLAIQVPPPARSREPAGWFWPDIRPVFGQIYALFLAKIYAQKAFLENTAFNTGRIVLSALYRAYIFMDLRRGHQAGIQLPPAPPPLVLSPAWAPVYGPAERLALARPVTYGPLQRHELGVPLAPWAGKLVQRCHRPIGTLSQVVRSARWFWC
jgi:hypothetical protein